MRARLVTAATDKVVLLADAKAFLRVDGSEDDDLVDGLVDAATAHIEKLTGRSICAQEWELNLDGFLDEIRLPSGPVKSIEDFTYDPPTGAAQAVDPSIFEADLIGDPARVLRRSGATWPTAAVTANAVRIRYIAGYETVPGPLRQAVLLLVGHWYTNREAVVTGTIATEVPLGVEHLIHNYRVWSL